MSHILRSLPAYICFSEYRAALSTQEAEAERLATSSRAASLHSDCQSLRAHKGVEMDGEEGVQFVALFPYISSLKKPEIHPHFTPDSALRVSHNTFQGEFISLRENARP